MSEERDCEDFETIWRLRGDAAAFVPRRVIESLLFYYDQLKSLASVPGDIVEFGTHRGTMLCLLNDLAAILDAPSPFRSILGFDTFAGFPASNGMASGPEQERRFYEHRLADDTSLRLVERKLAARPEHRVQLIVGDVFETLPRTLLDWRNKIALAILDLDAGTVTKFVLEQIWDRLSPGGLVCFDQYSRNGWSETTGVDEFLRERGVSLARLERGPRSPAAYLKV